MDKCEEILTEIKELKEILKSQVSCLEEIINLFSKYDQELLLEDDEIRQG